jgi:hypothetical protein
MNCAAKLEFPLTRQKTPLIAPSRQLIKKTVARFDTINRIEAAKFRIRHHRYNLIYCIDAFDTQNMLDLMRRQMITQIARKEFTEMLRDGRFRWAAAIVFTLLLASIVMGGKHYRDVKNQHDLAQAETREHWLRQPAKNPHSAAHYGIYAFKPKMLPAVLDRGVDPFVGQSVWLEAHTLFRTRPSN